jgi:hypothetical protein
MPVTLAQAQVNAATDVDFNVIDNMRRYSWLWDQISFDDTVTPGTGGGSMTYGYTRLITAASAQFRAINSEYVPGKAIRQQFTVNLKPMGGSFEVDRVLRSLGQAQSNEVTFQMQQAIVSSTIRFQQELILGDVAVDANGFDGLSKILTGTSTELSGAGANWSPVVIVTQAAAMAALDNLDLWLSSIVPSHSGGGDQGAPGALPPGVKAILGNTAAITRLRALARWAAMFEEERDSLGRRIQRYGDWFLIDVGDRADGATPIIPTVANVTDVYAVTFGLDSVHGASLGGTPLVSTWLPDFSQAGAVKIGEIEIGPAALCVKNTRAAGVRRGVQVAG